MPASRRPWWAGSEANALVPIGRGRRGSASLLAALICALAPAAAGAAGHTGYSTPGYRGVTKPIPTKPAALPTPITLAPAGKFPDVLVDGAGTSHIVWITSDGVSADAIHYCRLPRGASACSASSVLVPDKAYGDGDSPAFNTSTDGARIVQLGQQIVILDYRYPTNFIKPDADQPDASSGSNTVLEWVSEDGGASFTGPGIVGDEAIGGGVVAFGSANDPQILTTTDTVTGGTYVQSLSPGQYTKAFANLAGANADEAYSGSVALDGATPVAAFADLHRQTLIRRFTGSGSPNAVANWTPASVVSGDEPRLAGGPAGLFLMNRPAVNGPYTVRRVTGTTAGAPITVSDADDAQYRDISETPSGRLVVGWESRGGKTPGVSVRTSPDGAGWSQTDRLIGGDQNGQIAVGAADDGGGIAVLNHTGGVNGPGQIVAMAYGTGRATGVPGIAGVPGGSDPKATTTCSTVGFGDVHIKGELGCFLHGTGALATKVVSDGEFDLNGLRLIPDPGVQIIIDAHEHTLDTTGDVRVIAQSMSPAFSFTLWHGPIHIKLPAAGAETDLFNFDMSQYASDLDGFPIDAKLDVKLTADGVRIPIDLKLPAVFGGITGHAELTATTGTGLRLGSLSIAISNAPIGPLLCDFSIAYDARAGGWTGSGTLKFPPQPTGLVLSASVAFADGHFVGGMIDIKPPGFGLPVFTDVYIDDIHGGVVLEPETKIIAGVGIGVIPIGTPTDFVNTMQIDGDIAVTFADPFTIEVNGVAKLAGVPFEQAHLVFVSNGTLSLGGSFELDLDPLIDLTAGVNVSFDLPHKLFSAEFKANVRVAGIYDLTSADVVLSTTGFAVCGDLPPPLFSRVTVGHHFNHDYTDLAPAFDLFHKHACDLSGYTATASTRSARASSALSITLPHADTVNLAVRGDGGAPTVAMTGPDGKQLVPAVSDLAGAVTAMTAHGGPPAAAFVAPGTDTTVVLLHNPTAGAWQVQAQPGSPALVSVAESHSLPDLALHGQISGHGRKLSLAYRVHPRPGMKVTFAEVGGKILHQIGTAKGTSGTLPFAPADGPAGRRKIVALIGQDGLPRPRVTLASFTAPGPLRPGRVRHLGVTIVGHTLTVSFGAAAGAHSYRIAIRSTDGKRRLMLAGAGHRSARLTGLGPGAAATVSVTAFALNGRRGSPVVARTKVAEHRG